MTYHIDLKGTCTPEELHRRIREVLPVPDWYGNNLDAFYDIVTERPDWRIIFHNTGELRAAAPQYAAALERLCRDCGAVTE